MSDKPALPGGIHHYPNCGACYKELEYDGDTLKCADCRLMYDINNPESPAEYLDDEDEPCGEPATKPAYEKYMPREGKFGFPIPGGTWRFTEDPCTLPAGHTSDHWHQHAAERLTTDKEPDSE